MTVPLFLFGCGASHGDVAAVGFGGSTGASGACGVAGGGGAGGLDGGSAGAGGAAGGANGGSAGGVGGAAGGNGGVAGQTVLFPAFAPDLPTVLSAGGPVLADPLVIPIFFSNEDPARIAAVSDFLSRLEGSDYWSATTAEYGVGPLVARAGVQVADAAPQTISEGDLAAWLVATIEANRVPPPAADNVYLVYLPRTATISSVSGGVTSQSCRDFGGYHGQLTAAGQPIVYAVIAGCASYGAHLTPGETVHDLDYTTGLTTHELVEAATDPFETTDPAFNATDPDHVAWALYLYGGEVADTCELQPGAFFLEPTLGYTVQRMWSNVAAAAGHDPCSPLLGPLFFSATARLPVIPAGGWTTQAIALGAGATAAVEVDLASDAPTGQPWSVTAIDNAAERGAAAPALALSLDRTTGQNGDKLTLTIQVLAPDPSGFEGFILESSLAGRKFRTAGLVFQP